MFTPTAEQFFNNKLRLNYPIMSITRAVAQRSLRTLASSAQPRAPLAAKRALSTARPLRMVVSQARYDAADRRPSQWAKNPIVSYEELKPITQQPSDVSFSVETPLGHR